MAVNHSASSVISAILQVNPKTPISRLPYSFNSSASMNPTPICAASRASNQAPVASPPHPTSSISPVSLSNHLLALLAVKYTPKPDSPRLGLPSHSKMP
eukprot:scaffold226_cov167-Pinguiococcus_pyrenoidosus.AAC.13